MGIKLLVIMLFIALTSVSTQLYMEINEQTCVLTIDTPYTYNEVNGSSGVSTVAAIYQNKPNISREESYNSTYEELLNARDNDFQQNHKTQSGEEKIVIFECL